MIKITQPFWLYRVGANIWDTNGHRAIWSETYLTFDAPPSPEAMAAELGGAAARWLHPWILAGPTFQFMSSDFYERLWPKPTLRSGLRTAPLAAHTKLNVNAPEAAFRLQRVGAAGAIGRCNLPIFQDAWYTDIPHRRHVDLSLFTPHMATLNAQWPHSWTSPLGRHFKNVIFDRHLLRYEQVDHYNLLVNPTRLWKRWKVATVYPAGNPANNFVPPEFDPLS